MNNESAVLVFPVDMPQSFDFARTAFQLGFKVVAASSEPTDPSRFPDYVVTHLPYITDPGFDAALTDLLQQQRITNIFAPHPAIWWHLQAISQSSKLPTQFRLCGESPYEMDWRAFGEAYHWAETCYASPSLLACHQTTALPLSNYAGLYRSYNLIPGQSDNAKLYVLTQIARQLISGDIVEIGTLYGKSAFALAWLAKFHRLGSVICVDPWEISAIQNQGGQARLINAAVANRDWHQTFLGFAASLAMFDNVNYLREPSEQAVASYRRAAKAGSLYSNEFGDTPVKGRISLLHIDGNHKFEAVSQDLEKWLPFVMDQGWILFDDYLWAFGDGPKRVGDLFLLRHQPRTAFVAADTLFVQV